VDEKNEFTIDFKTGNELEIAGIGGVTI